MIATRRPLAVAFSALTLASAAGGEEVIRPRADFEAFGVALDRALARVSRPVAGLWLPTGEAASHGYHLQGYGAVFVSPARLLPAGSPPRSTQQTEAARALDQAASQLEEAMKRVDSVDLRRRMEDTLAALRQTQAELRGSSGRTQTAAPAPPADPAALEAELAVQVESLRAEAEQAQDSVERSVAEIERQLRAQLPTPAAPAAPPAPPALAAPAAPAPPAPPVPETPEAPLPPWRMWFEREPVDSRSPERVIQDVSAAVVAVLESHGPRLRWLKPEEAVVVAVDFVPRSLRSPLIEWGGTSPGVRSERTLVVRVRKRELEACRDGKLPREELRKRIDFVEY